MRLGRYRGWLALALALIVVGILSALDVRQSAAPLPSLSVRNAGPQGGRGLFLWLERIGYRVQMQTDSNMQVQGLRPGRDTFVVMAVGTDLSAGQSQSALRWVRAGGDLVLVTQGDTAPELLDALSLTVNGTLPGRVRVTQPLLLAPPVATLDGTASFTVADTPNAVVAAATDYGAVLLRLQEGSGTIWLLTAPDLLVNGEIARAENRRLLLNLVGRAGATVRFDEAAATTAPANPSQPDWLTGTSWGVALLFALAVLLLYRGLSGIRLGPPVVPFAARHRPTTEYVISLAGLLRRAHKRAEILRRYQQSLRRIVVERLGGDDVSSLDPQQGARVERLLAPPAAMSEDDLLRRAADIVECEEELRRTRV